jgi:hypothetical protein
VLAPADRRSLRGDHGSIENRVGGGRALNRSLKDRVVGHESPATNAPDVTCMAMLPLFSNRQLVSISFAHDMIDTA